MRKTTYRLIAGIAAAIGFAGLALFIINYNVDRLLRGDADIRSHAWTENLVQNVSDLPAIIGGQAPSDETIMFLEQARVIGNVSQFRIYGPGGKLILVSDALGKTNRHSAMLDATHPGALEDIAASGIHVSTRPGRGKYESEWLAETVAPIALHNKVIGYLGLTVDETSRRSLAFHNAKNLGIALSVVVLAAFFLPAVGLLRRTREKEAAEDRLKHLAYHDTLTGLKNRLAITESLESALNAAGDSHLAIHIVDLDNFKTINDTLGHDAGDACLRETASRLARVCIGHAEIGRLGGDEFLVVQKRMANPEQAAKLAATIVKELALPFRCNTTLLDINVSIGAALYSADGLQAADLLKSADIALYVAKKEGRNCYRFFKPEYDQKLQRRRLIESKLRHALEAGTFRLAYQPQIDVRTNKASGLEALLRLNDPELGQISPAEFIPIAEDAGFIEDIGSWVIAECCRSLALLPKHLKLALNLSAAQLERGDIISTVANAIADAGIDASRLELEITESLILNHRPEIHEKISALKTLGCSLALDDFGSGYSSLSYLWRYPFDKIKIDREFIAAMSGDKRVTGIIKAIMHLARELNMRVTAEGVETREQAELLRAFACDEIQGFLYAKPMPMNDIAVFLLRDISQPVEASNVSRLRVHSA